MSRLVATQRGATVDRIGCCGFERRTPRGIIRFTAERPTVASMTNLSRKDRDAMPRSCVFYVMTIDAGARPIKVHPTGSAVSEGEVPVMLFEELYERYLPHVFRYVLVLTRDRDEADDVTSETFARALRAWRSGSEPAGSTLPWLLTIARNVATDSWRRARRILGRPPEASGPSDAARVEGIMWLQSVSAILPGRQREVIALRYYRELSDSEIGAVMGLSQSGVRSLVARAIETLRKHPEVWQ